MNQAHAPRERHGRRRRHSSGLTFFPEYPEAMGRVALRCGLVALAAVVVGILFWRVAVHPPRTLHLIADELREHLSR